MIKHVVLVKLKPDASPGQIDRMLEGYNSMKESIPDLLSWSMGANLRRDGDYDYAMVAICEDAEALQRYVDHPVHRQVAQEVGRPIFQSREIADYEFDPEEEMWEPQVQEVWTELSDTVNTQHTALLVIDVQNDFCAPGGARMKGDLSFVEAMREPLKVMVEAARAAGVPVIYTQTSNDTEHDNGPILARRARVGLANAKYTVPGTPGWDVCDFVAPAPEDVRIKKWHHSGFTNPKMDSTLGRLGIKTLLFTGAATNGCVEATVRDAFARGYYNVVLEDCVAAYDSDLQRYSLKNMATHFALISSSREVQRTWAEQGALAG
jgi:ureidoacrylate peracid hydrolase